MERQKRQSADKISHHSCWLVATPPPTLPRFFCLRKLHKFNNSIVRNYFPPHYESFEKRLNFHLPRCCFWTELSCVVVVISTRISRSSSHSLHIHKHTLETENATPEMHFTESSEKYVLRNDFAAHIFVEMLMLYSFTGRPIWGRGCGGLGAAHWVR